MNVSEMLQNIEIIFCSINFIDKMRSWISKMCWVSTWFGRIYVLREIYRARHKLDRLIIRDYLNKAACGASLQSFSIFANRETNLLAPKVLLEDRWPMITIHPIPLHFIHRISEWINKSPYDTRTTSNDQTRRDQTGPDGLDRLDRPDHTRERQ